MRVEFLALEAQRLFQHVRLAISTVCIMPLCHTQAVNLMQMPSSAERRKLKPLSSKQFLVKVQILSSQKIK